MDRQENIFTVNLATGKILSWQIWREGHDSFTCIYIFFIKPALGLFRFDYMNIIDSRFFPQIWHDVQDLCWPIFPGGQDFIDKFDTTGNIFVTNLTRGARLFDKFATRGKIFSQIWHDGQDFFQLNLGRTFIHINRIYLLLYRLYYIIIYYIIEYNYHFIFCLSRRYWCLCLSVSSHKFLASCD